MGRIDLFKNPVDRKFYEYRQSISPVMIKMVNNHDEARKKAEKIADDRLLEVASKAIEINNEYYDYRNYLNLFNLFSKSRDIAGEFDGAPIGGVLRQKAINTVAQLKTDSKVDPRNLPDAGRQLFCESVDSAFVSDAVSGLNSTEIKKIARKIFNDVEKKGVFCVMPKDKSDNISLYFAKINSSVYDSLIDCEDEFKGLDIDSYEIPKEYQEFVKVFLLDRKNFSEAEAEKFIDIIKALETINSYNKKQQTGTALSVEREDVEFFDLSGDGLINRGDISVIDLLLKYANDEIFKKSLDMTTKDDWNKLSFLQKISKSKNAKETKNLFDLNGDGSANSKDYEFFEKTLKSNDINKFDINGDKYVDNVDSYLVKSYMKSILARMSTAKIYRDNTEEIFGGKKQLLYLEKKLAE